MGFVTFYCTIINDFFLSLYAMIIRLMSRVLVFSSAMCRERPDPERREEQTKYSRYDTKMYVE